MARDRPTVLVRDEVGGSAEGPPLLHCLSWPSSRRGGQSTAVISAFKREDFARWRAGEKLPDDALCKAVKEMENTVSRQLIESLRGDLGALAKAGAISKVTMRQFDAICPALKLLNVIADKGLEARTAATC